MAAKRYLDNFSYMEVSENQFLKTDGLSFYLCLLMTVLHLFPQSPGPAIPCHQPRAWSIPNEHSYPKRHHHHSTPLNGLARGLPWKAIPHTHNYMGWSCPSHAAPLHTWPLNFFLLLLPLQEFLFFSNSLRSKGRSSSLCKELYTYTIRKSLPQAASRMNRLDKQMLEGKMEARLHKLTTAPQAGFLPSRSEVLS